MLRFKSFEKNWLLNYSVRIIIILLIDGITDITSDKDENAFDLLILVIVLGVDII